MCRWYLKAQQINPKNGRPYNQLALLAHYAVRIYKLYAIKLIYLFVPFLLKTSIIFLETEIGRCLLLHAVTYVVESFSFCQRKSDSTIRREQEKGKKAYKMYRQTVCIHTNVNNLLIFFCRQYLHYVSKF